MKVTLHNNTSSVKAYYNYRNGTFWRVAPGETLEVEIDDPAEVGVSSDPPAGMQKLVNFYRNPVTGRMEVEYVDVPEE